MALEVIGGFQTEDGSCQLGVTHKVIRGSETQYGWDSQFGVALEVIRRRRTAHGICVTDGPGPIRMALVEVSACQVSRKRRIRASIGHSHRHRQDRNDTKDK